MSPRLTLKITEVAMALRVQTAVQMHARLLQVFSFRLQTCANDPIILRVHVFNSFHLQKLRLLVPPSVEFKRMTNCDKDPKIGDNTIARSR